MTELTAKTEVCDLTYYDGGKQEILMREIVEFRKPSNQMTVITPPYGSAAKRRGGEPNFHIRQSNLTAVGWALGECSPGESHVWTSSRVRYEVRPIRECTEDGDLLLVRTSMLRLLLLFLHTHDRSRLLLSWRCE